MSLIKKAIENYKPGEIDAIIIASRPGMGKTSNVMQLPNSVMIDYENSSKHFKGNCDVININEVIAALFEKTGKNVGPLSATKAAIAEIKASGHKYDFCMIDTISKINEYAEGLALLNYKNSPLGENFDGKSIFELSHGGGYLWHRNAFQQIIDMFEGIATTLILLGHVKDSSIRKNSNDIQVTDLDLTGSLKQIFSAKQDCAGIITMNENEPNKRYLSFKKLEEGGFIKNRLEHLRDKEILLSELMPDGTLKTHWNKVFLNITDKDI